jgi:O-antigen ligase
VTLAGRTIAGRALAAAILPLSAVCIYLTVSRGGVIALAVAIVAFLVLVPRRLETLATLVVSGAGAAILLRATSDRAALTSGLVTHAAISQGTAVIWIAVVICVGVGLLQVAISRGAARLKRPALLRPDPRSVAKAALALTLAVVAVAVVAGVPGRLEHAWHQFKQPPTGGVLVNGTTVFARLGAANGNNRYQLWASAWHAAETHPWRGIGPGTFQFWWAQHATTPAVVINAHSLYFETLGETGIIGLALLGGMLVWFAYIAVRRAFREPPGLRVWLAGASASLATFLFAAAVEWVWQLAALAAAALILGAAIVAGRGDSPDEAFVVGPNHTNHAAARFLPRPVLVVMAIAAIGAVLVPLAGQLEIRASQSAVANGDLSTALADSLSAQRLQPYSWSAHLQEALVLEAAGDFGPAAAAARVATTDSPTNWSTWLTLARIDARRGATRAALAELNRTRELNPYLSLFGKS